MNRNSVHRLAFTLFFLGVAVVPLQASAQSKEQREKIDRMAAQVEELKTEVMLLQRQVQTMLETFNKTNGELSTLIVQMSDNISAIRRAQSSVSSSSSDAVSQISSIGERVTATNQRMERLSEQFAQLRKLIEDIPSKPVFTQVTPGNADQLFAAAYVDYSRGNYELALSEFKQYVETFPSSEMTDNAQYWIGEILYTQKKFPQATIEFEKVAIINPNGDKAPTALYKRGLALLEMGNRDEAVNQFQSIVRNYQRSNEANLATQQLQQLAPELLAPPPVPQPERPAPTRPKPRKP
ncbi:MAG TPA: tol-pal system protein YbgF [Blastocatellia bacterium]|nr:tol-pal system protein YbgF [Blastocatellia bacterium]